MNNIVILSIVTLVLPLVWWSASLMMPAQKYKDILKINSILHFVNLLFWIIVFFNASSVNFWILYLDDINKYFYLLILFAAFVINYYSIYYFSREVSHDFISKSYVKEFVLYVNLFILSMLFVSLTRNFVLMWIWIEATTISTIFLISFSWKPKNWESAWKYVIICWIWVTIWLFWILTLLYSFKTANDQLLNFNYYTNFDKSILFNENILKLGFVFAFIWFATKVWIFPMNTWLPDAHSKAATPASAFLSSVLLPLALYVLFRLKMAFDSVVWSWVFTWKLFVVFGVITLLYCWVVLIKQFHFKRALAYSSSENMALATISFGLASVSPIFVFIWLFHIISHCFVKMWAFLTSWIIIMNYHSGHFKNVCDLPKYMKNTSFFLIIFLLLLVWLPPSPLFLSEILLVFKTFQFMPILSVLIIIWLVLSFSWILINFWRLFKSRDSIKLDLNNVSIERSLSGIHLPLIIALLLSLLCLLLFPYLLWNLSISLWTI